MFFCAAGRKMYRIDLDTSFCTGDFSIAANFWKNFLATRRRHRKSREDTGMVKRHRKSGISGLKLLWSLVFGHIT